MATYVQNQSSNFVGFMIKKITVASIAALVAFSVNAQKLRVSTDTVKYGTLFKYVTSGVNVTIYNDAPFDMQGVKLKTTNSDFTLSDTLVNIPAMNSKVVNVKFRPRHNVDYNNELIISTQSPYGAYNVHLKGTGFYSNTYYSTTQNKWEGDLMAALKAKISSANTLGYTVVRDQMYAYVDNNNDSVECVYTGRKAKFNTRAGAVAEDFTAEHNFPRSKYTSQDPMFSDVHHLFPADGPANTRRSDDPFGIVTSPVWMVGGSLSDNQKFEPRNEHKGTAARAMFYFVTRYQDYTNFFDPQEDLLRGWAAQFPVTPKDSIRHERAAQVQGNRNPFTDHPEFIERISNFAGTAPTPVKKYELTYSQPVNFGYVPLNETINYVAVLTNTGKAAVDYTLSAINPKPQTNVSALVGSFTIQPGETKRLVFSFTAKTVGTNFTDSFSFKAQGFNETIMAFTANVSGLGINEAARTNISLFPNPANAAVTLSADRALNYPATVNFYDLAGKCVYSTVLNESFTDINVTTLISGCYFVQVNDGTLSSITKLVKF